MTAPPSGHRGAAATRLVAGLCAAVFAVLFTVVVGARPAAACSCAASTVADKLGDSDVAFTGRLTGSAPAPTPADPNRLQLDFTVEQMVKGAPAVTVAVMTASSDSACGILPPIGELVGILADRSRDGVLRTGLCSSPVDPVALVAPDLLTPPTPFVGAGPPVVFGAGRLGGVTVLGGDQSARAAAYGVGGSTPEAIDICLGAGRVVTVSRNEMIVRDAATLVEVARTPTPDLPGGATPFDVRTVRCLDAAGTSVLWIVPGQGDGDPAQVVRLEGGVVTQLAVGPTAYKREDLGPTGRFVALPVFDGSTISGAQIVDARTGAAVLVQGLSGEMVETVAFDSDGGRLALVSRVWPNPAPYEVAPLFLRVIGFGVGGATSVSVPVALPAGSLQDMRWVGAGTLLLAQGTGPGVGRVVQVDLAGTIRWSAPVWARAVAKVGTSVFGLVGTNADTLALITVAGTVTPVDAAAHVAALDGVPGAEVPPPAPPVVVEPRFTG